MIDDAEILRVIIHDIRTWPGGRSINDDYEPDAFAPTTLKVVLVEVLGLPADHPLIARAESADWGPQDAAALIELIAYYLVKRPSDIVYFETKLKNKDRARKTAETRLRGLTDQKAAVLEIAEKRGILRRVFKLERGVLTGIAAEMNGLGFPSVKASDVTRHFKKLRDEGRLPQQDD